MSYPFSSFRPLRFFSFPTMRLSRVLIALGLASCSAQRWHSTDISGSLPPLSFQMTRARDGKSVTAADYKGKITLLYFGYTYCPDVCPMTLAEFGRIFRSLGPMSSSIRLLFVTVDPNRDTLPVLARYASAFDPRIDALRGDPNALASLARRYRVAYSARQVAPGGPYEVMHSSAVYVFDKQGRPRLLMGSLPTNPAELMGVEADLRQLVRSDG